MQNHIVLITGASSGIGAACAKIFAHAGAKLILAARRWDRLQQLADSLDIPSDKIYLLELDVCDRLAVESAINNLSPSWSNIDILINNAGLSRGLDKLYQGDFHDWEEMIDTNIKGLLYVTKHISQIMIQNKKGHIINIGSIAGKEVYANGNVYCATKHAVDALNKGMRIDLLPHGIKVSAVNPGMVETEFSIVRFDGDEERAMKVYENIVPLKPEDIAETIYWMASRPSHVNINDILIMPTIQANSTTVLR